MLLKFYGLREQPFGVTPDPRFLYLSRVHREALASLIYTIEAERGFVALIAPPGMGKTTLLYQIMQRFRHSTRSAFMFQTQCQSRELIRYLLADFGVDTQEFRDDVVVMHQRFNELLSQEARAGRKCLIVIDEAQDLNGSSLETVRLLSNFETTRNKLVQVVISGQQSLADKLAQPSMGQLLQRIASINTLPPLEADDVENYINHRLTVGGYEGKGLFTPAAVDFIARRSGGIPRKINNICFAAMSLGYALNATELDEPVVREAVGDLTLVRPDKKKPTTTADDQQHDQDRPIPIPVRPALERAVGLPDSRPLAGAPSLASWPTISGTTSPLSTQAPTQLKPLQGSGFTNVQDHGSSSKPSEASSMRGAVDTSPARLRPNGVRKSAGAPERSRRTEAGVLAVIAIGLLAVIFVPGFRNDKKIWTVKDVTTPVSSQRSDAEVISPSTAVSNSQAAETNDASTPGVFSNVVNVRDGNSPSDRAIHNTASEGFGQLVHVVQPNYPAGARAAHVGGTVQLQVEVDKNGSVKGLTVIQGDPALAQAAKEAVKQWKYKPFMMNGAPVEARGNITINFLLNG